MKTLIILRHAQAVESGGGVTDFERVLTDKGKGQALGQGRFLRDAGLLPERVLASTAERAMDTARTLTEASGTGLEVEGRQELYNAPAEDLLEVVRGLPDDFSTLLLVAHVPGVAQLLSLLTTEHVDLDQIYPPATLSAVQLDDDSWRDFDYGVATLKLFLPPFLPST